MINKRKLCSAEIVRRVGPRQWLCWMQQQLTWCRRWGEKEEEEEDNVEEDSQPGTSAGGVSNWGCQFARCIVFHPFTGAPINKGSTLFTVSILYYTGITNKPVLLTVLELARDRTILIFPLPDVIMYDMLLILAVTVQMGHDISSSLKE